MNDASVFSIILTVLKYFHLLVKGEKWNTNMFYLPTNIAIFQ